jgi:phosphoserine phosphatase
VRVLTVIRSGDRDARAGARDTGGRAMRGLTRLLCAVVFVATVHAQPTDPLPSWNDGSIKQRIVGFVAAVTDPDDNDFVPPAERIAVFDNDGTLWAEQPIYVQFAFALDRVRALAPSHPEWTTTPPFDAVLRGDLKTLAASGNKGLAQIIIATHTGMTTTEFSRTVADWIEHAQHPRFKRPYTDLAYQPMLELIAYLRDNDFKPYIVSGGTVEFMRPWSERVYGIPPEQVIGTTFVTTFHTEANGAPALLREPKIDFVDDGPGKPVAIQARIGRQPIVAFGNSDGDQQMLEWTAAGTGPRFVALVHHTDAQREWAYDRASHVGHLDKTLDEAIAKNWTVVDMKRDWNRVFGFEGGTR